jgi:hypothetical protein
LFDNGQWIYRFANLCRDGKWIELTVKECVWYFVKTLKYS